MLWKQSNKHVQNIPLQLQYIAEHFEQVFYKFFDTCVHFRRFTWIYSRMVWAHKDNLSVDFRGTIMVFLRRVLVMATQVLHIILFTSRVIFPHSVQSVRSRFAYISLLFDDVLSYRALVTIWFLLRLQTIFIIICITCVSILARPGTWNIFLLVNLITYHS